MTKNINQIFFMIFYLLSNEKIREFPNLKVDGIIRLNNSSKSFINVLYNLKNIPENKNIFLF